LQELIIFGSQVRGTAREDSDIDVLVVVDLRDWRERGEVIRVAVEAGFDLGYAGVAPLVLTPDEWQLHVDRELLIAEDILREGVRL